MIFWKKIYSEKIKTDFSRKKNILEKKGKYIFWKLSIKNE